MTGARPDLPDLRVRGGPGGIAARCDDLAALGEVFDETGDALRAIAADVAAATLALLQPAQLLGATALSPVTGAAAAAALAEAELGPVGSARLALELELEARLLREAVRAYRAAERAATALVSAGDTAVGVAVGRAVPLLALAALSPAGIAAGYVLARHPDEAERLLTDHPRLVEHLANAAPGLQTGLLSWLGVTQLLMGARGSPVTYEQALDNLALFFRDGTPVVTFHGPDPRRRPAPGSVADLLDGVARRYPTSGAASGELGVTAVVAPDGTRRWAVELPGTEAWPLVAGEIVRDTATNLHTMAGHRTVYQRGVVQALRAAGVRPGEDVLLAGHSQGGMTAVALAADPQVRAQFRITHVLAAGAPIARWSVPREVEVLALQNEHDLVPRLDGLPNPDAANVTTVQFDVDTDTVVGNHDLPLYARAARQLPLELPGYRDWVDSAAGFLDARSTATTYRFAIQRAG